MTPSTAKHGILRFILKTLLIALPPISILAGVYLISDPFKVLRPYRTYFPAPGEDVGTHVHKGMVSMENLLNYQDSCHFDSFIFGSSISCFYQIDDWTKHLPAGASATHLDSSSEGLKSMCRKVRWLERNDVRIRNALIVLDPIILTYPPESDDFLSMDPPLIAGRHTLAKWHWTFFNQFLSGDFLYPYLVWKSRGEKICIDGNSIFELQPIHYHPVINEERIPLWDDSIAHHTAEFYARHTLLPRQERTPHCSNPRRIDPERENSLRTIADIFRSNRTDFKVIVSPNIRMDTLSGRDLVLLNEIFGSGRVCNLSASMRSVALCDSNFYDNTHYRPVLARKFMDAAYSAK